MWSDCLETDHYPERFARTVAYYGEKSFATIRKARVMVIGLGGVGSHAAHALARSGVGALTLVDFDKITPSSLNRHPFAGPDDVDQDKADVLAKYLTRSCPDTSITIVKAFFETEAAKMLFEKRPDYVIDAIDSRGPKVALLEYCAKNGLPVVSSMGASARRDVGLIRVNDLFKTHGCPLARQVRKMLRKRGITGGITCVYSIEPAQEVLPPEQEADFWRGRIRNTLPSQISIPGVFGYAVAGAALQGIADSTPSR
jgi:tRNA threonylcarbamoyladenosine dehydratase